MIPKPSASDALIVVDVQHDFLPGGALGVPDGDKVITEIVKLDFPAVALTRDWHPPDHISFSDDPGFCDYSWPPHCVQDTPGAAIHAAIIEAFPNAPVFSKGADETMEAYSGFDGYSENGINLGEWLLAVGADMVYVVGLALDYCVRATALDALNDFGVVVPVNCTRPVAYETGVQAVAEMAIEGVVFG